MGREAESSKSTSHLANHSSNFVVSNVLQPRGAILICQLSFYVRAKTWCKEHLSCNGAKQSANCNYNPEENNAYCYDLDDRTECQRARIGGTYGVRVLDMMLTVARILKNVDSNSTPTVEVASANIAVPLRLVMVMFAT
jgi:hypothetical protein